MQVAPALFADAGPGCLRGACPEGEKSCGRARQVREERRLLLERMEEEKKNDRSGS